MGLGVVAAILKIFIEQLSTIADHKVVAFFQVSGMVLLMPGLFISMILSGNLHDSPIPLAAFANLVFYSAIGWLWASVLNRHNQSAPTKD